MEICSACHPFFTGKQKLIDTAGRVDRFNRRYAKKQPASAPLRNKLMTMQALARVIESRCRRIRRRPVGVASKRAAGIRTAGIVVSKCHRLQSVR